MANLPVCLPGLQGFPIQVSGWTSLAATQDLKTPNTLGFQLAPNQLWSTQNTFFLNGTQYRFADMRIVQPKQEGLLDVSVQPIGEFHLWGIATSWTNTPQIAVLSIPIFQKAESDEFGKKFEEALTQQKQLTHFLPQGKGVQVIQYVTCVETSLKILSITVAYWTKGLGITKESLRSLSRGTPFGIPTHILNSLELGDTLTTFQTLPDGTKHSRMYEKKENTSLTYASQAVLSVTTSEFKQGFRVIDDFTVNIPKKGGQSPFERQLDNYQCLKIDRQTDIKDGQLMIDPRTGEKLSDIDKRAEESQDLQKPEATLDTGNIFMIIAIVVGTILGIIALGIVLFFFKRHIIGPPRISSVAIPAGSAGSAVTSSAIPGTVS